MKMNLNLQIISKKIVSRWYLLVFLGLLFMSFVYVAQNFFQEKVYSSTVEMLVLPQKISEENNNTNDANIRLNIQLMNTYMNVMKSTPVLNKVKEKTGVKETVNEIRKSMTLSSDENSLEMKLKVNTNSPYKSKEIANQVSQATQEYLKTLFPENQLIVLNPADQGVRIQNSMNYVIALIMGVWSGIAVVIFELLSKSVIKSNVESVDFGFPIVGTIPISLDQERKNYFKGRREK
ncbi:YveK family protein [Enterococcus villorum]|uniref:YveK family protein n=1 Tax=Enterococcus villorum TaxID=112904 RepID=UPI0009BE3342|nr:Wzz/FepE/Etk N-terminal domain-containing protein [Enterococcus villorum]